MNNYTKIEEIVELAEEIGSALVEIESCVEQIIGLATDGLLTDGSHHKQWYLEQILEVCGIDLKKLREKLNLVTTDEKTQDRPYRCESKRSCENVRR